MPNWTYNTIAIRKEDSKYLLNEKREVDFNIICPMPKELETTISGGSINECVLYYVWKTSATKEIFFKRCEVERKTIGSHYIDINMRMTKADIEKKILDRISDNPCMYNYEHKETNNNVIHTPMEIGEYYYNLRKQYGYSDWYDWSCANWGVKWNACDTYIQEENDELICISFDTPWGPPVAFLEKLSKKCMFYLEWEEEQGYHGEIMYDGNDFIDKDLEMFEYEEDEDGDYERIGEYHFDGMKDNVLLWNKVA